MEAAVDSRSLSLLFLFLFSFSPFPLLSILLLLQPFSSVSLDTGVTVFPHILFLDCCKMQRQQSFLSSLAKTRGMKKRKPEGIPSTPGIMLLCMSFSFIFIFYLTVDVVWTEEKSSCKVHEKSEIVFQRNSKRIGNSREAAIIIINYNVCQVICAGR